jgi:hypothetical protein
MPIENITFAHPLIAVMLSANKYTSVRFMLFLFCLVQLHDAHSQQDKGDLVQFSGVVVTADSILPISFTHIYSRNSGRGTVADLNGFFSFVAHKGDVIIFSAIGFKKAYYRIPDSLQGDHYSLFQVMSADTIYLTETLIYPWPTQEQFRQAFLALRAPDDDLERAYRNLARAELKEKMMQMPMDAQQNYRNYVNKQVYNYSYMGMQKPSLTSAMNNPLLNPLAWAEFVKAWRDGKFKRND